MTTRVIPKTKTRPKVSRDSDDVAHIVMKRDQMEGYVNGVPILALCGKKWVPSKNPQDLPICQACVDAKDKLVSGMGGLN